MPAASCTPFEITALPSVARGCDPARGSDWQSPDSCRGQRSSRRRPLNDESKWPKMSGTARPTTAAAPRVSRDTRCRAQIEASFAASLPCFNSG